MNTNRLYSFIRKSYTVTGSYSTGSVVAGSAEEAVRQVVKQYRIAEIPTLPCQIVVTPFDPSHYRKDN